MKELYIEFDVACENNAQVKDVNDAIEEFDGLTVKFNRYGPGGGWPTWIVRFHGAGPAAAFLDRFGLRSQGETVSDYEVTDVGPS